MEQRRPLSFPQVAGLIAGLFLRRFGNRMAAGLRRKKSAGRTGTGRKSIGNPIGLVAIVVVFVFNSVSISSTALKTLASDIGPAHDSAGRVELHAYTWRQLRDFERGITPINFYGVMLSPEEFRRAGHELDDRRFNESTLAEIFLQESDAGNTAARTDYAYELIHWYEQRGSAGFVAVPGRLDPVIARLFAWSDPAVRILLIHALGLILLILAGARHCWTLGSRNQDLGQVEWSTEWLFTLPASSRTLFGAQIFGHAFVDPFAWIGTIPLLLVIYLSSGRRLGVCHAGGALQFPLPRASSWRRCAS